MMSTAGTYFLGLVIFALAALSPTFNKFLTQLSDILCEGARAIAQYLR